jgi:mono/diheme cytochrome c family protein
MAAEFQRCHFPTSATEEVAMLLKPLMLISAAIILAIAPASVSGRTMQEAAPAQAAAPATQAPAPVKGPIPPDTKNPVKPTAKSLAEAKTVFNRDCALCHGENGNGKTDIASGMGLTMPNWTDPKTLASMQDGELFDIIRSGEGKMPSEDKGRAKDNEVWNLIHYIRGFSKPQAAATGTPAR